MAIVVTEDRKVRVEYTKQQHREIEALAHYQNKVQPFVSKETLEEQLEEEMKTVRKSVALLKVLERGTQAFEEAEIDLWFAALNVRTICIQLGC